MVDAIGRVVIRPRLVPGVASIELADEGDSRRLDYMGTPAWIYGGDRDANTQAEYVDVDGHPLNDVIAELRQEIVAKQVQVAALQAA